MDRKLTLYHAPNSRSGAARFLLEALGVPYELQVLNLKKNEQRAPDDVPVRRLRHHAGHGHPPAARRALAAGRTLLGRRRGEGSALTWITAFKLVPKLPDIMACIERVNARPAVRRAAKADAGLAAARA